MVYFTQSKGHVCKSLVKARKPWLLLVIKRVVRHIFPACFGKICAASGVDCQSSADTAKRDIRSFGTFCGPQIIFAWDLDNCMQIFVQIN